MTRKSLLTILIFFVAMASFWFFSLKKEFKETKQLLSDQRPAAKPVTTKEISRDVASVLNSEQKTQSQADLQLLQKQLDDEQKKLNANKQNLEKLKAQQAQQAQQPAINYSSQIQSNSQQIESLIAGLRDYRMTEGDLSRRATEALREQSNAVSLAKDQLDENIRVQEGLIRQTQEDITFWTYNNNYVPVQQENLDRLNALFNSQQQRLLDMRAQRIDISASALQTTQNTQADLQVISGANADDQYDMMDEIGDLRNEIRRLEAEQTKARMSLMTLNSQINQAQREYNSQAQQVKSLEDSVSKKEAELQKLR